LNSYELAMIVSPDLAEKDVQKLAQDSKELLAASGATAISDEQIDRRALAYPIKKHNEANYVYINFSGPPTTPEKFRFEMRHREGLMRMAFVCKPVPKPCAGASPGGAEWLSPNAVVSATRARPCGWGASTWCC
jgi:ribosomal protein S6